VFRDKTVRILRIVAGRDECYIHRIEFRSSYGDQRIGRGGLLVARERPIGAAVNSPYRRLGRLCSILA
jgi:hypothetical protein